jgi:hypothetical protein
MVQPLQAGVRLTAIFDSCHSGTALDLPYIYSTHGMLKQNGMAKEAGRGLLEVISSYGRGDLGGVANSLFGFFKKATTGDDARNRTFATKTSPADVVMWSGSKDNQTSYVAISFPVTMAPNSHMLKTTLETWDGIMFWLAPELTMIFQGRCHDRCPSYGCHVLGLYKRDEKEPSAELRPAAQ